MWLNDFVDFLRHFLLRETYLPNLCLLSDCFHFSIFVAKRKFFGLHLAKSWRIVDAWIIYEAESFGAKKLTLGQNSIFFQNRWFFSVKIQIIYFIKASFGAKIHIFHFLKFIFSAKIQILQPSIFGAKIQIFHFF